MKKQFFSIVVMAFFVVSTAQSAIIYDNDFENLLDPLLEWSNTSTDNTPGTTQHPTDRFLGQFGNDTVSLTLNNLPSHNKLTVLFDLYVIRTWDGNRTFDGPDVWDLSITDGPMLLHTTFNNLDGYPEVYPQAYPGTYPDASNPPRTGSLENNTLGFLYPRFNPDDIVDCIYRLSYQFDHSSSSIEINFSASGLQILTDESWGIDNVMITPEPATVLLFGLGGLGLLRKRRA